MPRAGLDVEAVVSAAAELADTDGLQAVTLAALAKRLAVRPPSLYAHVDGLEDLRRRIGARGARELAAALGTAAAGRAGRDALEAEGGFGMPLAVEDSFERMVEVLHAGLDAVASRR